MMFKNTRAKRTSMNMNLQTNINKSNNIILPSKNTNIKQMTSHPPAPTSPKNLWGEPIWTFIHSICEKVKDDEFHKIKNDLIETLKLICTNLPCPDCSTHSKQYLDKLYSSSIKNKNDLKMYFFIFHNDVNKRTGKSEESVEILKKYEIADLNNVYNRFIFFFKEQYHSVKLISENLYRLRIAGSIETWFKQNNKHFNY